MCNNWLTKLIRYLVSGRNLWIKRVTTWTHFKNRQNVLFEPVLPLFTWPFAGSQRLPHLIPLFSPPFTLIWSKRDIALFVRCCAQRSVSLLLCPCRLCYMVPLILSFLQRLWLHETSFVSSQHTLPLTIFTSGCLSWRSVFSEKLQAASNVMAICSPFAPGQGAVWMLHVVCSPQKKTTSQQENHLLGIFSTFLRYVEFWRSVTGCRDEGYGWPEACFEEVLSAMEEWQLLAVVWDVHVTSVYRHRPHNTTQMSGNINGWHGYFDVFLPFIKYK